jgi:hypothetical protein
LQKKLNRQTISIKRGAFVGELDKVLDLSRIDIKSDEKYLSELLELVEVDRCFRNIEDHHLQSRRVLEKIESKILECKKSW